MEMQGRAPLESQAFRAFLRTGRRIALSDSRCADDSLAVKFNQNHDPDDGRFTFGPGGRPGRAFASNAGRSSAVPRVPTGAATVRGPFENHALRRGNSGDVARALNRVVTNPNSQETLQLGPEKLKIRRTGVDSVELSMAGGQVTAQGRFAVVRGTQRVDITLQPPTMSGLAKATTKLSSFPARLSIFEHKNGRLAFSIDRPIVAKNFLGKINMRAGVHFFGD